MPLYSAEACAFSASRSCCSCRIIWSCHFVDIFRTTPEIVASSTPVAVVKVTLTGQKHIQAAPTISPIPNAPSAPAAWPTNQLIQNFFRVSMRVMLHAAAGGANKNRIRNVSEPCRLTHRRLGGCPCWHSGGDDESSKAHCQSGKMPLVPAREQLPDLALPDPGAEDFGDDDAAVG